MKNAFVIMMCVILGMGFVSCTAPKTESTVDSTAVEVVDTVAVVATDSIK